MQSVFIQLLRAYRRHGYLVRTGLNPYYLDDPDAPFTRLFTSARTPVGVGAGLAPQELQFLELLFASATPPVNALVVGNAFGWSSIALGLLLPGATVVAMEAGLEGEHTRKGAELTRAIATEEGLDVRVVDALSPRDTRAVVTREFLGQPLDLVLIDGLHTCEQLGRDLGGVMPHVSPDCIFVLHDVLSWHLLPAMRALSFGDGREHRILTRCPSGMAVVFPSHLAEAAREVIEAFCDPTLDLAAFHAELGASDDAPGLQLEQRLAGGWKERRLGMAATYALEGRSSLEQEQLQLAAEEGAADPQTLCRLGAYQADRGRWRDAETFLRASIALAPAWEHPLEQLGRVLRETGRLDEARTVLLRSAELAATWAPPHLELGLIELEKGSAERAYPHFAQAERLCPGWPAALVELGCAAYRIGDDASAMQALGAAMDAGFTSLRSLHSLALSTERSCGAAQARPLFAQALALAPECAEVQFDVGRMCAAQEDDAAALHHFLRSAELRPTWVDPWREAFAVACRLLRVDVAIRSVTTLAVLGVESVDWWAALARLHIAANSGEAARVVCARIAAMTQEPPAVVKEIALELLAAGELLASREVLADLLARYPWWAGAHFANGRALEALDRRSEARSAYERAVSLRPEWAEAIDALSRLSVTGPDPLAPCPASVAGALQSA